MLEEFHKDSLIMYIEREIVEKCDSNVIIEEFFVKKKKQKTSRNFSKKYNFVYILLRVYIMYENC